MSSYISRFTTSECVYHIFEDKIIVLSSDDLSKIIKPKYLGILKSKLKTKELIGSCEEIDPDVVLVPVADELVEKIRKIVADCLLIINIWFNKHPEYNHILEQSYIDYNDFFTRTLKFIYDCEDNYDMSFLIASLVDSVKEIEDYLGNYHGILDQNIVKINDFLQLFTLMMSYSQF